MDHALSNRHVGQPICFLIRKFCIDYAIYILDHVWLVVLSKEDENVCMLPTTLLKLNDIYFHNCTSYNMFFVNVIDQLL